MSKGGKTAKAMTKSALFAHVSETTGLKKTEVNSVFDALTAVITKELGSKGPGIFTLPGLFKMKTRKIPAKKGGEQKKNPLNGEMYVTKPKPASVRVTARPVKALKEAVK
jgi:nucleoid DNA-binding protein